MAPKRGKATPKAPRTAPKKPSPKIYTLDQIEKATRGFRDVIGKGGFSTVYAGTLDGRHVAVKVFKPPRDGKGETETMRKQIKNELDSLSTVSNDSIITLMGHSGEEEDCRFIVYERLQHSVTEVLKDLDWKQSITVLKSVAKALHGLHTLQPPLVHGDLKLDNILMTEDNKWAKVGDFGSCSAEGTDISSFTNMYAAPEVATGDEWKAKRTSDIYSLGMVMLELITKKPSGKVNIIKNSINKKKVDSFIHPGLKCNPKDGMKVISLALDCLSDSAKDRVNIQNVLERLEADL